MPTGIAPHDSPQRWDRVMELLADALERPRAEREPYLRAQCGPDAEVLAEVRRLLAAEQGAATLASAVLPRAVLGSMAQVPPPGPKQGSGSRHGAAYAAAGPKDQTLGSDVFPGAPGAVDGPPPDIEGYRIFGRLGSGGMGVVWAAEQLATHRQVALKILGNTTFTSPRVRARFEREIELAARLEHPNIARVYDSGLRHGFYYYAMERIDGVPPDEFSSPRHPHRHHPPR